LLISDVIALIYRILFCILLLLGIYQLVTHLYRTEEKELRSTVRTAVKEAFPDHQEKYSETIGLFHYGAEPGAVGKGAQRQRSVVLIHGLDDPGKVWQELTPALVHEGYDVWQFEYPNDQPLRESAVLFFEELQKLRSKDIAQIAIVAHSMGGLISRELLTSETIDYHASLQRQMVPRVDLLIMVGTPNHGSSMVKLRLFSEVRDHLVRLLKGQTGWLNFVFDGAGEAKIDLLPGSSFLQELNGRPSLENIEQLIIAGVTSPWNQEDLNALLSSYSEKLPGIEAEDLDTVWSLLSSMTDGLGDGLVSVESTRLPGIPHLTVKGTHLSMIRNVTNNSERIPPALPIIIERLHNSDSPQS
jgi:pimeloyl-ACP methyl ester carboxylesterase